MKNGKSIGDKIASVDGFKRFLETYHRHLHQGLSFPPLKIAKALHAAAASLGFSSWQALRAAMGEAGQGKSVESGGHFYILTFHDQPRGEEFSLAMVGPRRLQSAADCLDTLMGYVLSRVGGGFGELLALELDSLMDEWVPDEERCLDEAQNEEFWDALVARLDWPDRARIIAAYFNAACDEETDAGCEVLEFVPPEPEKPGESEDGRAERMRRNAEGFFVSLEELGRRAQRELPPNA